MTREARDRLRLVPPIRRARGYRLYTADGRRFLDFWQADGRAILGHRGAGIVTELKRTLDRGVLASFPSSDERRLTRALGRLFEGVQTVGSCDPDFAVGVFATRERALAAIARTATGRVRCAREAETAPFLPLEPEPLRDAVNGESPVVLWRPFVSDRRAVPGGWPLNQADEHPFVIPVLPSGGLVEAEVVIGSRESGIDEHGEVIPAPVLALLARAADALVSSRERPVLRLPGFSAVGPYQIAEPRADYDRLYRGFLAAGIVLNPDARGPSIVPEELSDGERASLTRVAARLEGAIGS